MGIAMIIPPATLFRCNPASCSAPVNAAELRAGRSYPSAVVFSGEAEPIVRIGWEKASGLLSSERTAISPCPAYFEHNLAVILVKRAEVELQTALTTAPSESTSYRQLVRIRVIMQRWECQRLARIVSGRGGPLNWHPPVFFHLSDNSAHPTESVRCAGLKTFGTSASI